MTGREILISGAKEMGLSLEPGQVDSLFLLLAELEKWNKKINLTSITTPRDSIVKHLLDSLAYFKGFGPDLRNDCSIWGQGQDFQHSPSRFISRK